MSLPPIYYQVRWPHARTLTTFWISPVKRTRPSLWRNRGASLTTDVFRPYKFGTYQRSIPVTPLPFSLGVMTTCRPYSTKGTDNKPSLPNGAEPSRKEHELDAHDQHQEADHNHEASHSHSHSFFGHSHSNGVEAHTHGTEQIIAALEGKGANLSF